MKRITTIRRVVTCSVMTLVLLLHVAAAKAQVAFPNAQAIWTADNNTLTFVDSELFYFPGYTFNGHTVTAVWYDYEDKDVTESASTPAWNSTVSETLTTVVFDESFFQYIRPTNCCKWFANCQSLQTITGIENLNTSEVTNMSEMFSGCSALTSLDLSSFDTSNVTDMSSMFQGCTSLTSLNLSDFDTSIVRNMSSMFSGCSALTSLDLSSFDTSKVTNMASMFMGCSNLTSLNLPNPWFVDTAMFKNCSKLTSLDLSNAIFTSNPAEAFYGCSSLMSLNLSNVNTSYATDMSGMFQGCTSLTSLNLSDFDTSNVTNGARMFVDCINLTTIYCSNDWSTHFTSSSSDGMFGGCPSLVGGAGTAFDASHIDATYAHRDGGTANPGYFTASTPEDEDVPQAIWTAGNTTLTFIYGPQYDAEDTFNGETVTAVWSGTDVTASGNTNPAWISIVRSTLTKVVFDSSFASVRPTSLKGWFSSSRQLTAIEGISNLNTSEVTDMKGMFAICSALTSLDLSKFDTSNVTDMSSMFDGCSALTTIVCNDTWTPTTSSNNMFRGCTNLVGGLGTAYDEEHIDAEYACMDDAFIPGYFTATSPLAYDAQAIWTEGNTTLTFVHSHHLYIPGETFNGQTVTKLYVTDEVTNSGTSPRWLSTGSTVRSNLTKVVFDSSFASVRPTSLSRWFYRCDQLTEIEGISNLNTSEVTNMLRMFDSCSALTSLDLSNFNTSNVTDMRSMFYDCTALTTIICDSTWRATTNSSNMFLNCTSLVGGLGTKYDASHINAAYARVDDAFTPGYFTPKKPYIPQAIWTADNTTLTFVNAATQYATGNTFNGGTVTAVWSETDVTDSGTSPAWSTNTVKSALTKVVFDRSFASVRPRSLVAWFNGCSNLTAIEGISNLKTSEVTNMRYMFYGCSALTSLDLSNFDTSNVTNMSSMFYECSALTSLDVSSFNTSNVIDMSRMFYYCSGLTSLDLSNFDTSNVTNMYEMFEGCSSLKSLDLSNFDTRKVTAMGYMFYGCNSLTTIFCDSTWKQSSSYNMFRDCTSLVGGAGTVFNVANPVDKTYAHPDGGTTNPGYFTSSTEVITANKPGDKETYWATYYYSGSNTVALPAEGQNVKIYTAEYREEEGQRTLIPTEVTDGVIMAAQGVIIESNQPNITMKHSLTRTATDDFFAENELKGRDNACALPTDEGTIYTMGNVDGKLGFYKYTGSQLKARRAYLAIPAGSEAGIRIRFADEDMATGIEEVQSTIDKVQSATIYDLQGRRVVNPTKGIYIVNGKKVYMK